MNDLFTVKETELGWNVELKNANLPLVRETTEDHARRLVIALDAWAEADGEGAVKIIAGAIPNWVSALHVRELSERWEEYYTADANWSNFHKRGSQTIQAMGVVIRAVSVKS